MGSEALFRDKPIWKAIFILSGPAVVTILIMTIYNMADMFFISMLGDDRQVAAISVVGPVFSLATAGATMLGAGGCAVIAKMLGEQLREKASACGSMCIWVALIFGTLYGAAMLAFPQPILVFLGATEDLLIFAQRYMQILAAGAPFMLFSMAMGSIVRAEGAVIPGLISNLAGTILNILLDPLFILTFKMGISGAALATVIGNAVASGILAVYIWRKSDLLSFSPIKAWRGLKTLSHVLFVGLPNGINSTLAGFAATFGNRLLSSYGSGAIAAMSAANKATMIISMVQMGICMGVSPLLAYNYGAKNVQRVRETLQKVTILTFSIGCAAAIGCFIARDQLISMFLKDAAHASTGRGLMMFFIVASPMMGLYYLSSNFIQAAGNAFLATLVSVLRQGALLIPFLYVFHYLFGLPGIAAAHTASDLCAILAAVICCLYQYKKMNKLSTQCPSDA